jgi:hypothetical protein
VSTNSRNLAIVVGAVVVLLAVVLLMTRGTSPGTPGGPTASCGEGVGSPAPSPGCATEPSIEPTGSTEPTHQPSAGTTEPSQEPVAIKVGLGYIPSVQFAPFYLADQAGYYRDAGLDVTVRHGND